MSDNIYENLEHEEQLASLLGLNIDKHSNTNYCFKDANGNVVGTITKKVDNKKHFKKNTDKLYDYHVKIETDLYHVDYVYPENDLNGNPFGNNHDFEFDIKSKDKNGEESLESVELVLSDMVSVIVKSKENGHVDLFTENSRFSLNYETGNLEETIVYTPDYYGYVATIIKEHKIIQLNIIVEKQNDHWVKVTEQEWHDGVCLKSQTSCVRGTVQDALLLHEDGIKSFNFFIKYMKSTKELAPFSNAIIESLRKNKENCLILNRSDL